MGIFEFEAPRLKGVKGRINLTELVEYSKDLRSYRAWLEERFRAEHPEETLDVRRETTKRAQAAVEDFASGFLRDLSGDFLTRKMHAIDRLTEIQSEFKALAAETSATGNFEALQSKSEVLVREQEGLVNELRETTPAEPGPEARAAALKQTEMISRSKNNAEARLLADIQALRTPTGDVEPVAQARLLKGLRKRNVSTPDEVKAYAAETLGIRPDQLKVKLIGAEPGVGQVGVSGAQVYLVRAGEGWQEVTVAAVKIFPVEKAGQVEEFARELSALDRLGREEQGVVRRLGAHRTPEGGGVLIMSGAAGRSIDSMLVALGKGEVTLEEVRLACQRNGEELGRLHTATALKTPASSTVTEGFVKDFNTSLQQLEAFSADNPLLARDVDLVAVRRQANELIAGIRRNPGDATVVHGDLHPGNVFYDAAGEGHITMIDVARVHQSIDAAGAGMGSAARDAATFVSALKIFGTEYNVPQRQIAQLQSSFLRSYSSAVAQSAFSPEAFAFHRARYALRQLYAALTNPANRGRFTGSLAEFKTDFGLK